MIEEKDYEPDIGPFSYYLDAFRELSTCRINSMALGPIPFTSIVEYHKIFGDCDFDEFNYIIRLMDNRLLDLESKKSKEKLDSNGSKPNHNKNSNHKG
jgi:hypothetical protein